MNDESIAIAGWLLADLVLVLALLFLALTPGRDATATTIAAPVILDIGCVFGASDGEIRVSCTPEIGGGAASSFQWVVARGAPAGPSAAATFEASFEGAGAVGLTVSNDGGVHRATFPVLPSPTATPIAAPVILDIGCVADTSDGQTNVTCTPQLGGDAPSSYEWTAERGLARSYESSERFTASFTKPGAVTLTVSNDSGQHRTDFAVLPPAAAVVLPRPECSDVQTDFRFAQIVLDGAARGAVTWDDIASGRVRENLIKSQELEDIESGEWSDLPAEEFLREKLREQLRIALVETFSNAPVGSSVELSKEVNDVFHQGLRDAGIEILRGAPAEGRWEWFGDYLATRALRPGEVRLNLYFVKPFGDEDCQ